MGGIQRYAHDCDFVRPMRPDPAGRYVDYGDHLDAVAEALCHAIRAAEQRGYTHGYNDRARAEQRTLIEYGGRPSVPAGSGGMTTDVQMEGL